MLLTGMLTKNRIYYTLQQQHCLVHANLLLLLLLISLFTTFIKAIFVLSLHFSISLTMKNKNK